MVASGEVVPAKKTRYHKIHARSRTEARWAVFFDGIRLHYRYELEDTHLAALNKRYLPDFYLNSTIGNVAAEIKGKKPTDLEQEKCYQLCYQEGYPVLLINGSPYFGDYDVTLYYTEYDMLQCKVCGKILFLIDGTCGKCGNGNHDLIGWYPQSKVVRMQESRFEQSNNLVHVSGLPLVKCHLGNALQFAFKLASHARFEFLDNWNPSLYDGDCHAINPAFQTQDWSEEELLYHCLEGFFDLKSVDYLVSIGLDVVAYKENYEQLYNIFCSGNVSTWVWHFNQVLEFIGHVIDELEKQRDTKDTISWFECIFEEIRYLRDSLPLFFENKDEIKRYTLGMVIYLFRIAASTRTIFRGNLI